MENSAPSDSELLADWLGHHRETAFHALVSRYAGLVHSAAKRTSGDEALAAEASQLAFILLARKAKTLASRNSLAGWLHLTAVMQTKNLIRQNRRENHKRQLLQANMEIHSPNHAGDGWKEIQPVLDGALASLSKNDHEAVLLRFYRSLSVREIGETLGIATDAAQKRIDRATERLRCKLARRGCQIDGSLSGAMFAGFSGDAQAAVHPVSVLTSKAIAGSAFHTSTLTSIIAALAALTPSSLIAPMAVLVISGVAIGTQRKSIFAIENKTALLERNLASESTLTKAGSSANKVTATMNSTNWEKIAAELAEATSSGGGRMRRAGMIFNQRLNKMSRDEIIAAYDEVSALGLPPGSWTALKYQLLGSLIERDPEYITTHYFSQLSKDPTGASSLLSSALEKWACKDTTSAAAWLNKQIANGSLEGNQLGELGPLRLEFERALIGALVNSDPAAADIRLNAIPLNQRRDALAYVGRVQAESHLAFANLLRSHLDTDDQIHALYNQIAYIDAAYKYAEVSKFLDRIGSSSEERTRMVSYVVQRTFENLSSGRKATLEDFDEMRVWITSQSPSSVDSVTGSTLATTVETAFKLTFEEAATLATHYQEMNHSDDVLVSFLQNISKTAKYASQAKALAGKISDDSRRAEILRRFN